jgi:hypothetical protein
MHELSDKEVGLLKACASANEGEARTAQADLTQAVAEDFYKEGYLDGDIVSDVYTPVQLDEDASAEFILDLVTPGTEHDYIAFFLADTGHVPERSVSMNKLQVPTLSVGGSVNCPLKFLRQKRVDILGRMREVLEAQFTLRDNLDGWSVILKAGSGKSTVTGTVTAGVFDFPLMRAMKLSMRRTGGGNSTSVNRHRLTDLYLSPEGAEDVRQMTVDKADDFTRRQIAELNDMDGFSWQGVKWHVVDEFGEGQMFQKVWTVALGKTMTGSNREICVGLNLSPNGKRNIVNPRKRGLEMYADDQLHRRQEFGWYAWKERGWAVLTDKVVVVGEI